MDAAARQHLATLKARIPHVTPAEAASLASSGAALLDVREKPEWAAGTAAGAVLIPRGALEKELPRALPDKERTVLVYCQMGARSLLAAETLEKLGYRDVRSIAGGFQAWAAERLPVAVPDDGLSDPERRRYARHLVIPEVGVDGQLRLKKARVLLVGAGGLGSPAAVYLACAGVGTLGIIDFDTVDESNLQRQILHTPARLGMRKVASAKRTLEEMNPLVKVEAFDARLTSENADEIVPRYDVVVDGADNFPTRYLINDACVKHRKPNVHGSVFRFEGQASVFQRGRSPCYRCLYPAPPPPGMTQSCADAGVLGVLPGIVGLLQAVEAIKLILGQGDVLYGRLLVYDALAATFRELKIRANPECEWCAEDRPFPGYIDYTHFCS